MSVVFANKVIAGLKKYGVTVNFWPDWERRGNGLVSNYQGGIMHHTASSYGFAYTLLAAGRSDLPGPLCNSSGNKDGSVTIMAAHPANHAGASGGRSMGPLPVTSSFNKNVWGHEIVYPGDKPMTDAQYRTMIILGKVLTEILGRPNAEWIRSHYETSVTGKWDIGYAPGKTVNMATVRKEINAFNPGGLEEDDDMKADERAWLEELWKGYGKEGPMTKYEYSRYIVDTLLRVRNIEAKQAGMEVAIGRLADAVASNSGQDPAELKAAVKDAVAEALAEGTVDVDISFQDKPQ